jgi:hypothetical protein
VKKLIALALVAGFLAVSSIGCSDKKDTKSTGGSGSKPPASGTGDKKS